MIDRSHVQIPSCGLERYLQELAAAVSKVFVTRSSTPYGPRSVPRLDIMSFGTGRTRLLLKARDVWSSHEVSSRLGLCETQPGGSRLERVQHSKLQVIPALQLLSGWARIGCCICTSLCSKLHLPISAARPTPPQEPLP